MKLDVRLKGLKCIGQIRCSQKEQRVKSIPQQQAWLRSASLEMEMLYVDDMAEAISASQTRKRPDLERIFQRKALVNDFDVVLVQDLSRLTRGGVEHGLGLCIRFKQAGLRLVSIQDGLIEGDDKFMEAMRRFQDARGQARQTAMLMRRGFLAARKSKRVAYCSKPPYGIDRLIRDGNGKPQFLLRNKEDGSQLKMTPDGLHVLQEFPAYRDGESCHYVRQYGEFIDLVPGDPERVSLVNHLYHQHYVNGVNINELTRRLNDQRVPSPKNKNWCTFTTTKILRNPIYFGVGIGDRKTTAQFYKNGEFPTDASDNANQKTLFRPEDEWHVEKHPAVENVIKLPEDVRRRVIAIQYAEMRRLANGIMKRRGGDKHHLSSTYLLRNILKEKGTGIHLTGSAMSKPGTPCRYYFLSRAKNTPQTGNPRARGIRAERIEAFARAAVIDVLNTFNGLNASIDTALKEQTQRSNAFASNEPKLRARRRALLDQIEYWVQQITDLGRDAVNERVDPLKAELTEVSNDIAAIEARRALRTKPVDDSDAEALLRHVKKIWNDLTPLQMRAVLEIIVDRCEIDLVTGHVEMAFKLPSWVALNPAELNKCVEKTSSIQTRNDATFVSWSVPLGTRRGIYHFRPPNRKGSKNLPLHSGEMRFVESFPATPSLALVAPPARSKRPRIIPTAPQDEREVA